MLENTDRKIKKSNKRKRIFVSAIFLFVLAISLDSCKKEISDVGLGIQPDQDLLSAIVIDTFQLETYTELEDSLRTDELSNNIVGSYVDPIFGKVTSDIYTQLGLSITGLTVDILNTSVDSVKLQMRYANFYGELDQQTFSVHRVTEKFYKDSAYYSNKVLTTDGVELVVPGYETFTTDFYGNVVVGADTLNPMMVLNLDTIVGKDILNAVGAGSLANETTFNDFFYGLHLSVNNPTQTVNNGGLLYFDMGNAQTKMIIYYTENGTPKQLSFPIGATQARFSHFTHDYTGTPVADALATKALGQKFFYAQTMAGVRGVLKIKGLDGIKKLGNVIINKAELYLPIQYYTTSPYTNPSNAFIFYSTDATGSLSVMLDQLTNFATYGGAYSDSKKAYVFNFGQHLQQVVKGDLENLGFVLNTAASSVSGGRIVFNGQNSPNREKPYLKVYYTKY